MLTTVSLFKDQNVCLAILCPNIGAFQITILNPTWYPGHYAILVKETFHLQILYIQSKIWNLSGKVQNQSFTSKNTCIPMVGLTCPLWWCSWNVSQCWDEVQELILFENLNSPSKLVVIKQSRVLSLLPLYAKDTVQNRTSLAGNKNTWFPGHHLDECFQVQEVFCSAPCALFLQPWALRKAKFSEDTLCLHRYIHRF